MKNVARNRRGKWTDRMLFGFLYFWLSGTPVVAQSLYRFCRPDVIRYTRQQYGAYNQNWGLVQHGKTRFMYAANSKGLLEFDGSNWKTYELPGKQVVRSVAVDAQGDVYTGALGEFGYWRPNATGELAYHSLRSLIRGRSFRSEEIWHILVTPDGVLFQSFAYMYRYHRGRVQQLYPPGNILFVHQVRDRLLLGVLDKGLYDLQNDRFVRVKGSEFLGRETVNTLLPADTTGLLIGTERAVYRYDGTSFRVFNAQLNAFIQQNRLNRGLHLRSGGYAFGTLRNGLVITRADGQILYYLSQKNGLQNSTVLSLCQDADRNLWVGLDKGIDLINLNSPVRYFTDNEGELGTLYDMARFGNMLYLGTNQGVYAKPLMQPDAPFQLVPGTQGQVWDLTVVDNQLLCGHNRGTFQIEGMRATLVCGITGGWVLRRLRHHPDQLIQGTYTRLCLYRKDAAGRWGFVSTIAGFSGPARQLEEDEAGNIWVNKASNQGVQRLSLSDDGQRVVAAKDYSDAVFQGSASSLCRVQQRIIMTSARGILTYVSATDRFESAQKSFPWLGKSVRKLFPLSDSTVIIRRQDGALYWVEPGHTPKEIPVNTDQWVEDYENIVVLDTAYLALCRENGFELIPRLALPRLAVGVALQPVIRRVASVGSSAVSHTFRGLMVPSECSFTHQQSTVLIDFCTPAYTRPVRYRYWLENSMPTWSAYEGIHQKEFSRLPPGLYIFHLKSNLSPSESRLVIMIQPPWYWTIWSKVVYLVLGVLLLRFFYRLHLRRIVVQQNRIRERLEEQLRHQEEQSQREIILLQKEQLEQGLIQKSEELANSTMSLIQKNELLVQLKDEIERVKARSGSQPSGTDFQRINRLIDANISTEQDWKVFETNFNKVHEKFLHHLITHYPTLSQGDLKLAAYLRMNLSTKEVAQLLNITLRSVELKRYRLRKKLHLGVEVNLSEYMMRIES